MFKGFPLFPESASTVAAGVDSLYFYLVAVAVFFSVLIFSLIFYFAVKYRRRREGEIPPLVHGNVRLEILWSVVPFALSMIMFGWGAKLYFDVSTPPPDPLAISVVAKQWMWKIQHPGGQREINELHVPVGQPVELTMVSEDVIHSFYVPAFRVKKDVLPGRFSRLWFEATKVGTYHLFCAEYCGTKHSAMIGSVVVLEPKDYQDWLAGGPPAESPVAAGARHFEELGCKTCHLSGAAQRGPSLEGIYGKTVVLEGGAVMTVDDDYVRESILTPAAKIVASYRPLMPTFKGQVSEERLLELLAYVKSLTPVAPRAGGRR